MKEKHFFYLIFITFCLICMGCQSDNNHVKIQFGDKTFNFETALTSTQRERGLMFRKSLAANSGMLFVYSYPHELSFYMKNTLIPLDIAFFDEQMKILNIEEMEPLDETTIDSAGKAMYALEVNRGFFTKHDIKVGDRMKILTPIPYILQ